MNALLASVLDLKKYIYIEFFSKMPFDMKRYKHMLNYGWWTISPFLFTQKPPRLADSTEREEVTVIGSPTLGPNLSMMCFDSNHGSQKIRWIIVLHITKTKGCSVCGVPVGRHSYLNRGSGKLCKLFNMLALLANNSTDSLSWNKEVDHLLFRSLLKKHATDTSSNSTWYCKSRSPTILSMSGRDRGNSSAPSDSWDKWI